MSRYSERRYRLEDFANVSDVRTYPDDRRAGGADSKAFP